MNASMFLTFDKIRRKITDVRGTPCNDVTTRVYASISSGIVMSVVSLPADNIKVKLQKMVVAPDGSRPYTGMIDCFSKSIKISGIKGLWIGLPTYAMRTGPHSMIALFILETMYSKWPMNNSSIDVC